LAGLLPLPGSGGERETVLRPVSRQAHGLEVTANDLFLDALNSRFWCAGFGCGRLELVEQSILFVLLELQFSQGQTGHRLDQGIEPLAKVTIHKSLLFSMYLLCVGL